MVFDRKESDTFPKMTAILELVKTQNVEKIISQLLEFKKLDKLSELSKQADDKGNGFLQLAVLHHGVRVVKKFQDILGDAIYEMHLNTNHTGFTALQIAQLLPKSRRFKMLDLLLNTALEATKRCIDEKPLDHAELLNKFKVAPDSKLASNLQLGIDAVNFSKQIGLKSSTDPKNNTLFAKEYKKISKGIEKMRAQLEKQKEMSFFDYLKEIKESGSGNCKESAEWVTHFLYKQKGNKLCFYNIRADNHRLFIVISPENIPNIQDPSTWPIGTSLLYIGQQHVEGQINYTWKNDSSSPNVYAFFGADIEKSELVIDCGKIQIPSPIELTTVVNGDHVFTIYDRPSESDGVGIDSWSNKVFPAKQLYDHLMDHYPMVINDRVYHFLRKLNPKHHRINTLVRNFQHVDKVSFSQTDNKSDEKLILPKEQVQKTIKPKFVLRNTYGGFNKFPNLGDLLKFGLNWHEEKRKPFHDYALHDYSFSGIYGLFCKATKDVKRVIEKKADKLFKCGP